jgi:hypothetical protein
MRRRAETKAADLGVSLEDYVRGLVAQDLEEPAQGFQEEEARAFLETEPKADISTIFGLIDEGPPTNIGRDKDRLVAEAVWDNYLRKVGICARLGASGEADAGERLRRQLCLVRIGGGP